jgi:hypothetical protein
MPGSDAGGGTSRLLPAVRTQQILIDAQHVHCSASERGPMDVVPGCRRADNRKDRCHRFLRFAELFRFTFQVTAAVPTTTLPTITFWR